MVVHLNAICDNLLLDHIQILLLESLLSFLDIQVQVLDKHGEGLSFRECLHELAIRHFLAHLLEILLKVKYICA